MQNRANVAIVGAGILGLAHAYEAARRGLRVVVFERSLRASGASVRNFGMIWPIGQPHGVLHQLALRSRARWVEVLEAARLPYWPSGSLHVVYREDEAAVAREFAEVAPGLGYQCSWLNADQVLVRSNAVQPRGLMGALWSDTELTVDPRVTLASLPRYLEEKFDVVMRFGCCVRAIQPPVVEAGDERWNADHVIVCSGDDFESLYPEVYAQSGLTRVKLQMLRTEPQPGGWRLGPALAAGLTLRFYPAFSVCSTLSALKERIAAESPGGFWRGVNVNHNAIYTECFMDEIAKAVGQGPLEFRRKYLKPKNLAVLNAAAEKAGWGTPPPQGVFRGLAQYHGYATYSAAVAEVSITNQGRVKIERIVVALDPGTAVNPAQIERQAAGSFVYGISALLYGEITVKDGAVEQKNFDTYNLMRLAEMPKVEVILMPSGGFWGGIGEPTIAVAAPAVLNAIAAATGRRVRSVPLKNTDLRSV